MKAVSLLIISLFILFSCQQDNSAIQSSESSTYSDQGTKAHMEVGMAAPRTAQPPVTEAVPEEEINEKIIKTGYMQMDVPDILEGKSMIDQLMVSNKAYYENEEYHHSDFQSTYTLNIRIPAGEFEDFIEQLESGKGNIVSKNISSRNVTEQFVDLEIRLNNKDAYLAQYHELLKKTGSVKDLLEVQERIRRLSEEIESTKGRLRYLSNQVGHSTLHLTLVQHHDRILTRAPMNIGKRLGNALRGGLESAVSFIIGIVSIWPFLIGIVLLFSFRGQIIGLFRK